MDRRSFVRGVAGGVALAGGQLLLPRSIFAAGLPSGALESEELYALPGKQPLIKRSFRPPNFETPVGQFTDVVTPNDRFFVRWHLASIPEIDPRAWRLAIGGDAASTPYELSLEQLQRDFEQVEIVAVCQCSGTRRGLSDPHVPGVQWGYGAMGNARWKGVRLKDLLARAGIGKDAVEIAFDGADRGALDATPDFVKSIPVWKAMDENTLVAWQMNGEPLPHWNGAPARIIVPGWTATYWMKKVVGIRAVAQPVTSFWMAKAYRIPKGKFATVDRFTSQETPREHADHRDRRELADHQRERRTEGQGGFAAGGQGHRMGCGLRHPLRGRLGRWRSILAVGGAGRGPREVLLPGVAIRVQAGERQVHGLRTGLERHRRDPGRAADLQPGGLQQQRHPAHRHRGRLRRGAMRTTHVMLAIAASVACACAGADESTIRLKEGPDSMTVAANCSGCHSLDYIQMNSRFMKRATWEAEVKKMVSVMGAPVSDADQAKLVDYLTREYGVAD